jgi:hypothetical protein
MIAVNGTEYDRGFMEVLVTIFGGLAIAFAGKACADWKAKKAFEKENYTYMVRPKRTDGVLWPMQSFTENFSIFTSVCPKQQLPHSFGA